jgi:fimbrial chaperone protein
MSTWQKPQRPGFRRSLSLVQRLPAFLLAALGALAPLAAVAGEYSVSPMRISLDRDATSSVVTLNNSGTDRMSFQISVMEWTQDSDGRDRYSPTSEVIFFPKIRAQPGDSRVVRVGVQAIPGKTERTFRLFIEPLPATVKEPLPPGAQISVNLRFALPIFVKPPARSAAGEIEGAAVSKGVLKLTLRNTGNEHLRTDEGVVVTGRDAQGNDLFTEKIDSRYVLAGAAKSLTLAIPKAACARVARVEITAQAEQLTLSQKLDVGRASCE